MSNSDRTSAATRSSLIFSASIGLLSGSLLVADSGIASAECYCVKEWLWGGCAQSECVSTLSDDSSTPSGPDHWALHLKNTCSRAISSAVNFMDLNGDWKTEGWFNLAPGEDAQVADTRNRPYYTYAHTQDPEGLRYFWTGDKHWSVGGTSVGFTDHQIKAPNYGPTTFQFSCPGVTPFHSLALAWSSSGAWATRLANTDDEAKNAALEACRRTGANCAIAAAVSGRSRMCIALAGKKGAFWNTTNANIEAAKSNALSNCNSRYGGGCGIVTSICN